MKRAPVPGGELEYDVRGDGEPVLLIHGSHVAASFLPVMDEPALADYRLIRYHRRGFAGSADIDSSFSIRDQAADAEVLLQRLGVDRAHVVGHSYGGTIALQLALDAPELVHSLVLMEPAAVHPSLSDSIAERMGTAMERYQAGDTVGGVNRFMQVVAGPEWRMEVAGSVPGGPKQAEQDAATFFEVEVPALDRWEFDEEKARQIDQPVLHMWGSETLPSFKRGRDMVYTWWPETDRHRVEGVNHALQMQDPRSVAEAIADFLRQHPF